MPPRTPKPCSVQSCGRLTISRYCEAHKHLGWENHQAGRTTTQRGYGASWQRDRLKALQRDKYLCQDHLKKGLAVPATDVDHIKAKAHGGTDDLVNLVSLCRSCHKYKTARERTKKAGKK